jgi:hypothetical protein
MARITTYALDSNISLNDKLVGTDADDNSITKNYSIDTLGDGLISLKSIITGTGTLNAIPIFTPDGQKIGDSIVTQAALGQGVNVAGQLDVAADFYVTGSTQLNDTLTVAEVATFNDEVDCNNNVTVQGIFSADGNTVLGDSAADTTTINSTLSILSVVKDSNDTLAADGQILVANAASELLWKDNFVLTSPGGTQYKIVVDDAGVLSTIAV